MPNARLRTAGVIGTATVLLGGCGGDVAGTPVAELWDPCSLPAEVLEGAGVEPGVVEPRRIETDSETWVYCSYRAEWALMSVISTTTSFDVVANDGRATERRDVTIGNAPAVVYSIPGSSTLPSCYVTAPRESGSIQIRVTESGVRTPTTDVCVEALSVAELLLPAIPR